MPVETQVVPRGPIEATVEGDGRTRIRERQIVSAPFTGRAERVVLRPGDRVLASSVVTTMTPMEPPLLDVRARALGQAQLKRARAAYQQALARQAAALAADEYAQGRVARLRGIGDGLRRATQDALELDAQRAAAELASARSGVSIAASDEESARSVVRRLDSSAGGASVAIPVPIDGLVLRVFCESAGPLEVGAPIIEVGVPSSLEAVVDLRSSDAVKASPGATVHLDDWGGRRLEGRVRVVEPAGFSKVSALGIEEQRVNVVIDLDVPSDSLRLGDGYGVHARIVTYRAESVVKVPFGALVRYASHASDGSKQENDEDWAIYVVQNGRANLRRVRLGERSREETEIVAGLDAGERIIVHLTDNLAEGTRVSDRR